MYKVDKTHIQTLKVLYYDSGTRNIFFFYCLYVHVPVGVVLAVSLGCMC